MHTYCAFQTEVTPLGSWGDVAAWSLLSCVSRHWISETEMGERVCMMNLLCGVDCCPFYCVQTCFSCVCVLPRLSFLSGARWQMHTQHMRPSFSLFLTSILYPFVFWAKLCKIVSPTAIKNSRNLVGLFSG